MSDNTLVSGIAAGVAVRRTITGGTDFIRGLWNGAKPQVTETKPVNNAIIDEEVARIAAIVKGVPTTPTTPTKGE